MRGIIVKSIALLYGGIVDLRERKIPNLVPLLLIAVGLINAVALLERFVLMLCVAAALWLSGTIRKEPLPGGDFKLICALTFSAGLPLTVAVLFCVGIEAVLVSWIWALPLKRNIPLCSYTAGAYIAICAFFFCVILS